MNQDDKGVFLEIYKIYVCDATQVASKRHLANVFMIAIASALFKLIVPYLVGNDIKYEVLSHAHVFLSILGVLLCLTWYRILDAYCKLSSAKFDVVNDMEKQLPYAPYTEEWRKLEEQKYKPMTKIEREISVVFGFVFFLSLVLPIATMKILPH